MPDSPTLDRVAFRLENWRRQLIDLTRRNRLLNYRPTKASTVEVVDEVPQQVLRQLLEGEDFQFDPVPDPDGDPGADGASRRQMNERLRADRRIRYGEPLREVHQDDRLQTRLTAKRLDRNLLNIFRRSNESMDEQGVNTLYLALGMLKWFDADSSDVASLAPVLMFPVALARESAASPFVLSGTGEDPLLNPALVEKLRLDFQIELPGLPEAVEDLDLEEVFKRIESTTAGLRRWELVSDVALGLFSFQKFIMYRDLGDHEARLSRHEVVRAICQEDDQQPGRSGLPLDVRDASLDEQMSPWESVQVLDADSSQQRAMLAVRRGHHLVIEGPPGTGKSQTITNVIADALNQGKKVLFVSEKMAALEVVKSRLEHNADLGAYVLELHSNKTSKTAFVEELSTALDQLREPAPNGGAELTRLKELTDELRAYVIELHRPEQPLGQSPFEAIGKLAQVEDAERVSCTLPGLKETDPEALAHACRRLDELSRMLAQIGDPAVHPLRGVRLENAGRSERRALQDSASAAAAAAELLTAHSQRVSDQLGLRMPDTLGETQLLVEVASVVARSPGADESVLQNPRWNQMSEETTQLLETGKRYENRLEEVREHFRPEILDQDLTETLRSFAGGLERGLFRFVVPSYWRSRKELRKHLRADHKPSDAEVLLREAEEAHRCREDRTRIGELDDVGRELFGGRWNGPASDWSQLQGFAEWVVEFRSYALEELLADQGLAVAARAELDVEATERAISDLTGSMSAFNDAVAELVRVGQFENDAEIHTGPSARIGAVESRSREIADASEGLRTYSLYVAARSKCDEGLVEHFVPAAAEHRVGPSELTRSFRKMFYEAWLESVISDRPVLARFQVGRHEQRIQEFMDLDDRSFKLAKSRTLGALRKQRQDLLSGDLRRELGIVQHEARKRRRILPVRKLLGRAGRAIQEIKPCFMMSPLSVAQYLDPDNMEFDLLVFDEASQIPPADAIGSIMRAKQVVVVGDSKQLPPTNFFGAHLDDEDMEEDEEMAMLDDLESILDEVAVAGVPNLRLKWHYRSEHQSLIRFSNEEFYSDDPLLVFPSAVQDASHLGLQFEYVAEGVYEGRGRNPVEARRVARAVLDHIKDHPSLTLGIGTFGIAQQSLIMDELDRLRREDPSIEWFFAQDGEEKFFVKNLENIQGDDRDVIFLSVTYGPDHEGRVQRNFGPINKEGGWRRLNVLTTRAKRKLKVFSSMLPDQIDTRGVAEGAVLLQQYLRYARTGEYPSAKIPNGPPESPFEEAVIRALRLRGQKIVPQVGDGGYRVDIGVLDPDMPGRYVCGIECDGATYHSAATVRDRDRLRQQVLELRGWEIHRVWSTDWFHDPDGQVDRLVKLIEHSLDAARRRDEERRSDPERDQEPAEHITGDNGAASQPSGSTPAASETRGGSATAGDVLADSQGSPTGPVESDDQEPEQETEPLEAPPYELHPTGREGTSDDFYAAPLGDVARVCKDVIMCEGPIHMTELSRRVAGAWEMRRAGGRIVQRVGQAVGSLEKDGVVVREEEFLTPAGQTPVPVRSRDIDGVTFSTEHIAPSEVREAIRIVLRHRAPLLPDEVIVEAARLLGFKRTGKKLQELIEGARQDLIDGEEIRPGGLGLHLVE